MRLEILSAGCIDPCEGCPYYELHLIYQIDGKGYYKEVCMNPKPCPYIELDTIS